MKIRLEMTKLEQFKKGQKSSMFKTPTYTFVLYRLCSNIAIYILVGPVSLKLLAAGENFWVLYSFCGENVDDSP